MEIHGDAPEVVEHWMGMLDEGGGAGPGRRTGGDDSADAAARRRHAAQDAGGGAAGAAGRRRRAHRGAADGHAKSKLRPVYAAATSSIVLYGFASFSAISSLISGHAGSISLARKLNFGLRG